MVLLRLLPVVVFAAAVAMASALAAGPPGAGATGAPLLPDLDQEPPGDLVVTRTGTGAQPEYRLGFRSAVRNVGDGPLIVDGTRAASSRDMVADQVVARTSGPRRVVEGIGKLRYVVSPDHRHWHLLGFERYELRAPRSKVALVRDGKTGFCLGDRYVARSRHLRYRAPQPVYTSSCGLDKTELLGLREGISVGHGDDYAANLEGQYLPLTGLADGRYVLVHRVNVDRRIREIRYANNAASVLFALDWRLGIPYVRVLATCAGSSRCRA